MLEFSDSFVIAFGIVLAIAVYRFSDMIAKIMVEWVFKIKV